MELYVRKVYQKTHNLKNMTAGFSLNGDKFQNSPWIRFEFVTRAVEAVQAGTGGYAISYSDLAAITHLVQSNILAADSDSEAEQKHRDSGVAGVSRCGIFVVTETCEDMERLFSSVLVQLEAGTIVTPLKKSPKHVIDLVIAKTAIANDDEMAAYLQKFLAKNEEALIQAGVRRVSFIVAMSQDQFTVNGNNPAGSSSTMGSIFTFRARSGFMEDHLFRHIESAHAFHLDLMRLDNFDITLVNGLQTSSGNVQLYMAIEKGFLGVKKPSRLPIRRYYARLVSFTSDVHSTDAESLFVEALDTMALAIGHEEHSPQLKKYFKQGSTSSANHIFLNVVAPEAVLQPDSFEGELHRICMKYSQKMVRLNVATVEFKLTCRLVADGDPLFIRLVASNPTGYVLKIDAYYEAIEGGVVVFRGIGSGKQVGEWEGRPVTTPYPVSERFEAQRAEALQSSDTLYVYDWPILFEKAAGDMNESFNKDKLALTSKAHASTGASSPVAVASPCFTCQELVLGRVNASGVFEPLTKGWTADEAANAVIQPVNRDPGLNCVGMVAWLATLRSPEFPNGRQFVIVANDITHNAGSFGTKEDLMFYKVSEFCRARGLPRLYLAANSGARIGMAQSLKSKFKVCWIDSADPTKGFQYIYLTPADYEAMLTKYGGAVGALPVICEHTVDHASGEERYIITDIIGEEPDLGVENLMGSGLIAGETSKAYDDVFTITLVVGRTVGIGAYLVRLGQRTIQKTRSSPIILTGYQALNKLMGREIYTTNDQLGGPMIMFPNGVSHLLADHHLDCVVKALTWLSFVPSVRGGHLPIRDLAATGGDQVDRRVLFTPTKGMSYDPRHLLNGHTILDGHDNEQWVSGFFDRNSFVETLAGWAKTVVVGRARLGGIPMGVIVTENRTAEATKPADPADVTSAEKLVQQAGGVWFPDSAYKTAQALRDFNREDLPCIIFANWRGFSGGQRDMFDEVLKFGSMIVDALVAYKQPLFVYIPPFAELRGGAWVVVDSTINPDVMEFYAAEDARGGVLEANGAVAIKFRERDLKLAAHRLDHDLITLDKRLAALKSELETAENPMVVSEAMDEIQRQIVHRERMLLGVYQQVAVHFADLHDTPGRMKRKGVIRRQVNWAESRVYFYWRLRRRLMEFEIHKSVERMRQTFGPAETPSSAAPAPASESNFPGSLIKSKFSKSNISNLLEGWFVEAGGSPGTWSEDDRKAVAWLTDNQKLIKQRLLDIRKDSLTDATAKILHAIRETAQASASVAAGPGDAEFISSVLRSALAELKDEDKAAVKQALSSLFN
jgi:acetyl-CoA carboxylase/biotin carboxylase 1